MQIQIGLNKRFGPILQYTEWLYNWGGSSNDCIKKQINLLIIVVKWLREGDWIWTWLDITGA